MKKIKQFFIRIALEMLNKEVKKNPYITCEELEKYGISDVQVNISGDIVVIYL